MALRMGMDTRTASYHPISSLVLCRPMRESVRPSSVVGQHCTQLLNMLQLRHLHFEFVAIFQTDIGCARACRRDQLQEAVAVLNRDAAQLDPV
jgi:hypothetical protein